MAGIVIPQKKAATLRQQAGDYTFPEGAYIGVFESFEIRDLPSQSNGQPFAGYATTDGERLSIRIGSIQPVEGQEDPGGRKFFVDLVLRDGDYTVENWESAPSEAWQIERAARYIVNLAIALDAAEETEDGDFVVDDSFLESLRNGDFEGRKVGFIIYHNKARNGKVYAELESFAIPF